MSWDAWIDVGGTFTDCFVCLPDGEKRRLKLLSSGLVPVAGEFESPHRFRLPAGAQSSLCDGFWCGGELRVLSEHGSVLFRSRILNSDQSMLQIDDAIPPAVLRSPSVRIEIASGLESPVLGVRMLLGVPLLEDLPPLRVRLGTTRGTNALLTRNGASTVLAITAPFEDVPFIGDQTRPNLFDLQIERPAPVASTIVGIEERLDANGKVLVPLNESGCNASLQSALAAGCRSLAICLLHSYLNPEHELRVEKIARQVGFKHISRSSQLAPLIELVARTQTTMVDAYLSPVIREYMAVLAKQFGPGLEQLYVMTSGGGLSDWRQFAGKDSILSGPAGGAVALQGLRRSLSIPQLIGLDMGGTSTDVCRIGDDHALEYESVKAGVRVLTPTLPIETVASGGGSLCWFDGVSLRVGPQSAGASPGPACYGRGGPLTITDLNVFLGRLPPHQFPFPLDLQAIENRLQEVMAVAGKVLCIDNNHELAHGFRRLANEQMSAAVRMVSTAKGIDPRSASLVGFGGAAGQHICEIAELIGVTEIIDHPDAGLFSALGMGLAGLRREATIPVYSPWPTVDFNALDEQIQTVAAGLDGDLLSLGCPQESIERTTHIEVRYLGTDTSLAVERTEWKSIPTVFHAMHQRRFGYQRTEATLELVSIRIESQALSMHSLPSESSSETNGIATVMQSASGNSEFYQIPRDEILPGHRIPGPAIILNAGSTLVVDVGWEAECLSEGTLRLRPSQRSELAMLKGRSEHPGFDPVTRDCIGQRLSAIANQMGVVLQQTAISVNVKQRRDFSCALFDASGHLLANAPHVPVHLGAMGETVRCIMAAFPRMRPGDSFVTNDPYRGGSHLPDITVVTPVFDPRGDVEIPAMFVANRAHHADVGGVAPGSMSVTARCLGEEGVILPPMYLSCGGVDQMEALRERLERSPYPPRAIDVNLADLAAQQAANLRGVELLVEFGEQMGWEKLARYGEALLDVADKRVAQFLAKLDRVDRTFIDYLDDGTAIGVRVHFPSTGKVLFDFSASGPVNEGNFNANPSIVNAAVMYVLRCLIADDLPMNEGILRAVELKIPKGVLNPRPDVGELKDDDHHRYPAVAAGNVETSQRVVDVLLGAFGVAAASQGTMNNLLFGDATFGFYETICGGAGATEGWAGASGVHSHMTNTRLTDPEVLESRYPVRLKQFGLRRGSGGAGHWRGGDGVIREFEFLKPVQVSLLTSRRGRFAPYGAAGGHDGKVGRNLLIARSQPQEVQLPNCCQIQVQAGDCLRLETPGGGGYGVPVARTDEALSKKESAFHVSSAQSRLVSSLALIYFCWLSSYGIWGMPSKVFAQEVQVGSRDLQKDDVDQAVDRALSYLLTQQRADGAITDRQYDTTMTALSVMAMASVGITPNTHNERGGQARKALDFVLREDRQDKDGYYGNKDGSRMYGHGIITLMLTEMLGMGVDQKQNEMIVARCQRAIDLILSAQKQSKPSQYAGAWRYTPNSTDADLSVSVWQLMALRSAKNDGLKVPASAIDDAVQYLRRSYTSKMDSGGRPVEPAAGFSYVPGNSSPTFAMTAAGLLAMEVCGQYDSPLVLGASDWLLQNPPKWDDRFFFYGTYYYAQGMYQRGGKHAETAEQLVRSLLLDKIQSDGAWVSPSGEEAGAGKVYATCMAILSLSVKYHYLPIYQK